MFSTTIITGNKNQRKCLYTRGKKRWCNFTRNLDMNINFEIFAGGHFVTSTWPSFVLLFGWVRVVAANWIILCARNITISIYVAFSIPYSRQNERSTYDNILYWLFHLILFLSVLLFTIDSGNIMQPIQMSRKRTSKRTYTLRTHWTINKKISRMAWPIRSFRAKC